MSPGPYLRVAIDVPLPLEFDYLPPAGGASRAPGTRVVVPFGRRRQVGIVMGDAATTDLPASRIRQCIDALDDDPLLAADDLRLIRFASDYYHHPIGEVVAAALPALLRQGKPLAPVETRLVVTDAGLAADPDALARRAPRQAELLQFLRDAPGSGASAAALTDVLPNWRRAAKPLLDKGLVTRLEGPTVTRPAAAPGDAHTGPVLNAAQQVAVDTVASTAGFAAFLLDGVTGSGKTEVYLRIIADALAAGRQALVLVPEIGLTPQLVARIIERLGIDPAVLHSGLSDVERLGAWRAARDGTARLVVGTRSAVFTPLPDLGLIVVDEEHDHSLKQQEGLRYSARDLALVRGKQRAVPVILGSATPTLESLQHCIDSDYVHLELPERAGGARPPAFELVDISRAPTTDGLSEPLAAAIDTQLGNREQVLIYLNRRGFAPTLICSACGDIAGCERCDSRLTVHASDRSLRCHHCGASRPLDEQCQDCGGAMRPLGEGTQRIEESLRRRFPAARIRRIDSDTTQQKGAIATALAAAEQGDADILVGTQMLSKGHHFPKLTLVGIVNADQGLFGTDFRSGERLAQSIIQVAGRAGRESRPGRVIIQTAFAAHPFWRRLIDGGYPRVVEETLAERRASHWPPFTWLALVRAAAPRAHDAHAFLARIRDACVARNDEYLRALGPVDAPMARRAGLYRAQLLLQSSSRRSLHAALAELRPALVNEPAARRVRWSIDVDPIELF